MPTALHRLTFSGTTERLSLKDWQSAAESLLFRDLAQDFWNRPLGSDLWLDGLTAVRAFAKADIPHGSGDAFVDLADDLLARLEPRTIVECLARFDAALMAAQRDEATCWKLLGLALTIITVNGTVPRLWHPSLSVVNDSVMLVLSPLYRWLRFEGFNRGAYFGVPTSKGSFLPELGRFSLPSHKAASKGALRRVPNFSISHELTHFVLFGDLYAPSEDVQKAAEAIFAAEAKCISIDLYILRDLKRLPLPLELYREYDGLTAARRRERSAPFSLSKIAEFDGSIETYDRAIRAFAAAVWAGESQDKLPAGSGGPTDIACWMDQGTFLYHRREAVSLASRLRHQQPEGSPLSSSPTIDAALNSASILGLIPAPLRHPTPSRRLRFKALMQYRSIDRILSLRALRKDPV